MADSNPVPSRSDKVMDRLKGGAGVIAAVVGSVTALYGVYEKVRSDAKEYTATSYETLAPKLNEMNDALKKLQEENQQLRDVVTGKTPRPRPVAVAPSRPAAKPGTTAGAAQRSPSEPAAEPAPPAPTPAAPAGPAQAAATPPPPPAQPTPAAGQPDPLTDIFGAVNQARQAVQDIRKVPETFEKALQQKR